MAVDKKTKPAAAEEAVEVKSGAEEKRAAPKKAPAARKPAASGTAKTATAKDKKIPAAKTAAAKKPAAKKPAAKTAEKKTTAAKKAAPKAKTAKAAAKEVQKKKVLFVASEIRPFAASGGLGEVIGSLPAAINRKGGYDVRAVMPLYESVLEEYREKMEFKGYIYVPVSWRSQYCGIFELVQDGVTYYFLDNEYYFRRPNLYGYYDDGERFAFFSRAAIEFTAAVDFKPDVISCHDWQTALTPIYYKLFYMYNPNFSDIGITFTIHNIEYQGKFPKSCCEDLFGIPFYEISSIEHDNCINLMKGAIDYCETISTVSPTYAQEILHEYYGHGLDGVLQKNAWKLRGILNGIDTKSYDPQTDPSLFANYGKDTVVEMKGKNKRALQEMLNLPVDENIPMVAVISRLVQHKGMDLIKYAAGELLQQDIQFVLLGKGEAEYENYFTHIQSVYNNKVCAIIAYNADLSRKLYASADIFLMPSKSEPCGLSQMIACRYGTVPVVRETGGLFDSITDCGDGKEGGNGFAFSAYNAGEMLHALTRAIYMYKDYRDVFNSVVQRAMACDFTWDKSADDYIKMFEELIY